MSNSIRPAMLTCIADTYTRTHVQICEINAFLHESKTPHKRYTGTTSVALNVLPFLHGRWQRMGATLEAQLGRCKYSEATHVTWKCLLYRAEKLFVALTGPGSELTHQEDPDTEYGRSKKKKKKTTHIKEKHAHWWPDCSRHVSFFCSFIWKQK